MTVVPGQATDSVPDWQATARDILRSIGADTSDLVQCPSRTNSVWATETLVVRISLRPDDSDLIDEAGLVPRLPPGVAAPVPVTSGRLLGHAWSVWRRQPGQNLGELWDQLSLSQQVSAVQDICALLGVLGQTDPSQFSDRANRYPFSYRALDPSYAAQLLEEVRSTGALTAAQAAALASLLHRMHDALPAVPARLAHGDVHFHNFLFHGGRVTTWLDWEATCLGPADLDVDLLLRSLCHPKLAQPQRGPDMMDSPTPEVIRTLGTAAAGPFAALRSLPGLAERLAGYDAAWLSERVVRRARYAPALLPVTIAAVDRLLGGDTLAQRTGWID